MNHINKMKKCYKRKLVDTQGLILSIGLLLITFLQCAITLPNIYNSTTLTNLTNFNVTNKTKIHYQSDFMLNYEDYEFQEDQCLLKDITEKFLWWVQLDGKLTATATKDGNCLDLSWLRYNDPQFLQLAIYRACQDPNTVINKLSLAFNKLQSMPNIPLKIDCMQNIQYLSLTGNNISTIYADSFTNLENLLELDLRANNITNLRPGSFQMMYQLRNLYLSFNNIKNLDAGAFFNLTNLWFLDLSYIPLDKAQYITVSSPVVFNTLKNLTVLNLSHTFLNDAMDLLLELPSSLKVLDLCYTGLQSLYDNQFAHTSLIILDLSHNPLLGSECNQLWSVGLSYTLKFLSFTTSNLESIHFLVQLPSLEVLKLSNNSISELDSVIFQALPNLRLLDLQANYVSNWYTSVFQYNQELRLLDLRSNRLNLITTQMQNDFKPLYYLALSKNQLICSCIMRSLIDLSECNYGKGNIMEDILTPAINFLANTTYNSFGTELAKVFIQPYEDEYKKSLENIRNLTKKLPALRFSTPTTAVMKNEQSLSPVLHLQLFDYNASQYLCYNVSQFIQLEEYTCQAPRSVTDFGIAVMASHVGDIVAGTFGSIALMIIIAGLLYWKRWHIHYYYVVLKTATLWSMQAKSANDHFTKLNESEPHHLYDIFISYCQNDRDWVLEQLLPNIEKYQDVSLCLHERDFEIGVTIMDNIVSSMDRSRAMMLIVSQRSLLSHWCQFEMVLAQQRVIESHNEQLLLVLLDDIPKNKRPKALQYLMKVKTYIKWPANNVEEQKIFWFRLQRSLQV